MRSQRKTPSGKRESTAPSQPIQVAKMVQSVCIPHRRHMVHMAAFRIQEVCSIQTGRCSLRPQYPETPEEEPPAETNELRANVEEATHGGRAPGGSRST